MTFRISGVCIVQTRFGKLFRKDLEKNKINYLTLTFNLGRQGQTHFYMTFVNKIQI